MCGSPTCCRGPAEPCLDLGERRRPAFPERTGHSKSQRPAVVQQQGATYWAIFDEQAKRHFRVAGSDWTDFAETERVIFGNPILVKAASSLSDLAAAIGVPPEQLQSTVRRYNGFVASGDDHEFGRFGPSMKRHLGLLYPAPAPTQIVRAPFYGVQFFLLTRKSMGGVSVDRTCRVLSARVR